MYSLHYFLCSVWIYSCNNGLQGNLIHGFIDLVLITSENIRGSSCWTSGLSSELFGARVDLFVILMVLCQQPFQTMII